MFSTSSSSTQNKLHDVLSVCVCAGCQPEPHIIHNNVLYDLGHSKSLILIIIKWLATLHTTIQHVQLESEVKQNYVAGRC